MYAKKILAVKYNKDADESRNAPSGNIRAVHMPGALADGDTGVHCNIWLNRGVIYAESAFLT